MLMYIYKQKLAMMICTTTINTSRINLNIGRNLRLETYLYLGCTHENCAITGPNMQTHIPNGKDSVE